MEAWWPFVARVFSFFMGSGIMFWQTVVVTADRPWLIAAATGMMGLPVANVIGRMLSVAQPRAGGQGDDRPKDEPPEEK
ncbi:MAG: hypothetical protein ABW167_19650 [Baekduia sp.]